MNYICEHRRTTKSLEKWAGQGVPKLLTPKFFFSSPGSSLQKSSVGLLRSLLYQILHKCPEFCPLQARNEPLLDWTEKRLTKIFKNVTSQVTTSYRVCFFIDGLDEFSGDHKELIALFQRLVESLDIKVVLSSRPYPAFNRAFGSGAMLKLEDLTRPDIKKSVSDKLGAHPGIHSIPVQEPQIYTEDIISYLIYEIVWKSDGVFLWVDLAVKDSIRGLDDGDSREQLQERLRILPTKLEDLYAHMLYRIKKIHREEAAWFLQFALLEKDNLEDMLLHFVLAVYEWLDRDLRSSADFLSQKVSSHYSSIRKRIIVTCAGLLEVHGKKSRSEAELNDLEITNPEKVTVTFLHRTGREFFLESEQGKRFLDTNASPNRNVYVVWAKVLVTKLRMLGFAQINLDLAETNLDFAHTRGVVNIMEAASKAEYETGRAQTAVCEYIDIAMTLLGQKTGEGLSGSHWCTHWYTRICEWVYWMGEERYTIARYKKEITTFHSMSDASEEDVVSRSTPEEPIDYLGFKAMFGLKLSIQQQMMSLSGDRRLLNASYCLSCAIGSLDLIKSELTATVLDLICTLLNYGVNPNTFAFGSTLWGCFLFQMLRARLRGSHILQLLGSNGVDAWRTAFECFIDNGADTNGILSKCHDRTFEIQEEDLQASLYTSVKIGNAL